MSAKRIIATGTCPSEAHIYICAVPLYVEEEIGSMFTEDSPTRE